MASSGFRPPGGAEGTRTPDLLRAREALSQLSYSPICQKYYNNKEPYTQFYHSGLEPWVPLTQKKVTESLIDSKAIKTVVVALRWLPLDNSFRDE